MKNSKCKMPPTKITILPEIKKKQPKTKQFYISSGWDIEKTGLNCFSQVRVYCYPSLAHCSEVLEIGAGSSRRKWELKNGGKALCPFPCFRTTTFRTLADEEEEIKVNIQGV